MAADGAAGGLAEARLATLMVVLAAIGFGLVPLFARMLDEAGLAPPAVAFWRYALAAAVLGPLLLGAGREKRPALLIGAGTGALMGLGWIGYVEALRHAPVATVGLIYMSYPLFTLGFAWALLGIRPQRRAMAGAGLILAAAALVLGPAAEGPAARALLPAFAAPAGFGLAIVVLTGWLGGLSPLERMAVVPLGGALGLVPVMLVLPAETALPAVDGLGAVLGFALLTMLLPGLLYVTGAPRIGAARTAAAGSIELPTMLAIGWFAHGETIGLPAFAGAILVLVAIPLTPAAVPAPRLSREATDGS